MNPFFTRCLTFGLIAALTLTTAAASAETVKIAYGDNAIDTARVIKILTTSSYILTHNMEECEDVVLMYLVAQPEYYRGISSQF